MANNQLEAMKALAAKLTVDYKYHDALMQFAILQRNDIYSKRMNLLIAISDMEAAQIVDAVIAANPKP